MAGFVDKFKRMWDAPDDEYQQEYDEYGYADENEEEEVEEQQPVRERAAAPTSKNKVVNNIIILVAVYCLKLFL